MAVSIAEMILLGLLADWIFRRLKMPGLLGMLLLGVVCGPFVCDILQPGFLEASADLRMIALIIILLRAGLELNRDTLNRVGIQALLLSFVPGIFEGATIALLGPHFLPLTRLESAMLGFIVAAVSPAVVVPMMIDFIERKMGAKKGIPTLVLAAASLDDVVAIVIFSVFLGLYTGTSEHLWMKFAGIPVSVVAGIAVGLLTGVLLLKLFERFNPRATKRTMILIGVSILLVRIQYLLEEQGIAFAALLAVMATGFIFLEKHEEMAHEISSKLGKLWVFASIMLFTLVGAQVDISLAWNTGLSGLLLILCGLMARSLGVGLSLFGSPLNMQERLFVVVSYWPKATVQAAMGAVPLMAMGASGMDTGPGEVILAVSVMSIIFTAPIGAVTIRLVGERVLEPGNDGAEGAFNAAERSR
ncbi:cation:proton antiporter [Pontiella agarivorans]|uniref:Cation:proton antiporter n=1 Tax=Pontiella agarivorans TaxID=3038953 RepID=A0ABU5N0Y8_9BACT|nr:cation:proton antiporter [Pontiella agarivorans]MDZ8120111.1 cation:proton antiporter [Pontiella agarivorans]